MTRMKQPALLKSRLLTMEPAEILSRLSDVGRYLVLYPLHKGGQQWAKRQPYRTDYLCSASNFHGQLGKVCQDVQSRVFASADQWLHHCASFFALRDIPLGNPINWHCDYSSGLVGPKKYSGFIKHSGFINRRESGVWGDVRKYIWELNRLQHLVLLALASVWTGRETYREEIVKQTLSWCAQNPFMRGLNWISPLEASLRLISWALVTGLTRSATHTQGCCHEALRETVYLHQYFIRNFHSKHSSANNHLIGEMAGLYIGSVVWPWYRESTDWRSFARQTLVHEMTRQVEADGVSKERAIEYHLFTLELFLLAGALGSAIGQPFPSAYWGRLKSMVTFLATISDREGNCPRFGDGDSGQVVGLPETIRERTRALVQLSRGPLGGQHGKTMPDLRSVLLLWGQEPEDIPLVSESEADRYVHVFPQGGYYVLATHRGHDHEMMVVFDAGPLGLPPLHAHGHADALSFWLSYGGHEFLIDPGTYSYHPFAVWRAYFRSTAAHNTVRIDGEDQSIASGNFLWRHIAHSQAEYVEDNEVFVEVEGFHDGYRRLADPVIHRRRMRLYKKSLALVITDQVECQKSHNVEVCFHFGTKCQVQCIAAGSFVITSGHKRLRLHLDSRLTPELYRGSESPIFGWVSPTFGVKEPTFTLVARARVTGATQFVTEVVAI